MTAPQRPASETGSSSSERHQQQREQPPPPPVRRNRAKVAIIIGCGVVLSAMLLVVIVNLDRSNEEQRKADPFADATELIEPPTLTPEQLADGTGQSAGGDIQAQFSRGAWIEVADPADPTRLAQRYRIESFDPNPSGRSTGWIDMQSPQAEIFLSSNRVVRMRGETALAYVPHRALESGTISGNVVIQLYDLPPDRSDIRPDVDTPILTVHTDEAEFDNFIGEVICRGDVHVTSDMADILGRQLSLKINDQENVIEQLRMQVVDAISVRQRSTPKHTARATSPQQAGGSPADRPAAGASPSPGQSGSADETPAVAVQRYRLTLVDNVVVRSGDSITGRALQGDSLVAVFSTDSSGLGDAIAAAGSALQISDGQMAVQRLVDGTTPLLPPVGTIPTTLSQTLTFLAMGQSQAIDSNGANEETIITFDGPLVMEPLEEDDEPQEPLLSPEDIAVVITGQPVTMNDFAEDAIARCGKVTYHQQSGWVELLPGDSASVELHSPAVKAHGELFKINRNAGAAAFVGAGSASPGTQDDAATAADDADAEDDPDKTADDSQPIDAVEEMSITWSRGVDLQFEPSGDEGGIGSIRSIVFNGDVEVLSADGTIMCRTLEMEVATNESGRLAPEKMVAAGDVKTIDADRTMWADTLVVTFDPSAADDKAADSTDAEESSAASSADRFTSEVRVTAIDATGNVQVLLADGSRAFADRLAGDNAAGTLELAGNNIVIASGQILIENGQRLTLYRDEHRAVWDSPGKFRALDRPVPTQADRRIPRPIVDNAVNTPTVRARWNQQMIYDHGVNDGAGRINLRGDVVAYSQPNPQEENRMNGAGLTLDFAWDPHTAEDDPSDESSEEPSATDSEQAATDLPEVGAMDNRVLARFVAEGDARLENRTWMTPDRSDPARVFYIAGPVVDYNNIDMEAIVDGEGEMIVRDLDATPDQAGDGQNSRASGSAAFSGKGTSHFQWSQRLHMQRLAERQYSIEMLGQVQAVHQALSEEVSTLTADSLTAVAVAQTDHRSEEVDPDDAESAADERATPDQPLDFGGRMALRRLTAEGSIFVHSRNHKVDCDYFDYNIGSVARARARPGRTVSVLTEGAAYPLNAQEVLWDMQRDTITVLRGSGTR